MIATIRQAIDGLVDFPRRGRSSQIAGVRELVIVRYRYIVFYAVDDAAGEVRMLRVRHASRGTTGRLE